MLKTKIEEHILSDNSSVYSVKFITPDNYVIEMHVDDLEYASKLKEALEFYVYDIEVCELD